MHIVLALVYSFTCSNIVGFTFIWPDTGFIHAKPHCVYLFSLSRNALPKRLYTTHYKRWRSSCECVANGSAVRQSPQANIASQTNMTSPLAAANHILICLASCSRRRALWPIIYSMGPLMAESNFEWFLGKDEAAAGRRPTSIGSVAGRVKCFGNTL